MIFVDLPVEDVLDEIKSRIGVESPPAIIRVEEGAVKKYMHTTEDTNPIFYDKQAARDAGYEGRPIPPAFVCPDPLVARMESLPPVPNPWTSGIDAGSEWEFLKPVYIGDTLKLATRLTDVYMKVGRNGRMMFVVSETVITNQRDEKVALARGTSVWLEGVGN